NGKKSELLYFNPPRLLAVVDSAEFYEAESVLKGGIRPGALIQTFVQGLKTEQAVDSAEFADARLAASILYDTGHLDEALRLGLLLQRANPRNGMVLGLLGRIYLAQRDFESS